MKTTKLTAAIPALLLSASLLLSGCTDDPATTAGTTDAPADVDLEALVDKIYGEISGIEFPSLINGAVDLSDQERFSYVYGIDAPASATSAVASEPMMSSIPYTMALLELNDTSDIASIANSIEKGVDPRKWICVTASTVKTVYKENVILLIMDGDANRAQAVIDAFLKAMD